MKAHPYLNALVFALAMAVFPVFDAAAKIDLVTLSDRSSVQTTIYNHADLTLVRDKRVLSFVAGINRLQFSWANTKIDPTSLGLEIKNQADKIEVVEITYPPGTKDVGIWQIRADKACQVPVEITYFTSGISWKSYYIARLARDMTSCSIKGYVTVTNTSGEDYADAETRLVVGKINILDRIADLASRPYPYGRPEPFAEAPEQRILYKKGIQALQSAQPVMAMDSMGQRIEPKEIGKQGMSEFFLYTIEGKETIPHGWAKRLLSFEADKIRVKNLYKYEIERFGDNVVQFLTFKNSTANHLGQTPLPGGEVKVFHSIGETGELDFLGSDQTKYIPVDKKVALNLGSTLNIKIVPRVMAFTKKNILFDKDGTLSGFDEVQAIDIQLSNFTDTPATVEYVKNLDSPHFTITDMTHPGAFERTDQDTIKFTLDLAPHSNQSIRFTQTALRGERRWQQ